MGVGAESQKSGAASDGGLLRSEEKVAREMSLKFTSQLEWSEISCCLRVWLDHGSQTQVPTETER